MTWRYFRNGELREALAHVDAGGVAIHESGRQYRGHATAHLLAGSRRALMTAAEEVGVEAKHLQFDPRPHFDLWGDPLMLALAHCMEDERPAPRKCRKCGCTDDRACPGGCYWVSEDLCSRCAPGIQGL